MSEQTDLQAMFSEDNVPDLYFNGVTVATTKRDSIIFLYWNDKLRARLNASHITAKELKNLLHHGLQDIPADEPDES